MNNSNNLVAAAVSNRQPQFMKTNNSAAKNNMAKSPQPLKLTGNMTNEIDMTRASPAQIQ